MECYLHKLLAPWLQQSDPKQLAKTKCNRYPEILRLNELLFCNIFCNLNEKKIDAHKRKKNLDSYQNAAKLS